MKKTLQQKVATANYKRPNKFVWWVICHFIAPFAMKQYGKQITTVKDDINKYGSLKFDVVLCGFAQKVTS